MLSRRRFLTHTAALASVSAAGLPLAAQAQAAWPAKPVRVVIPYGGAGVTDTLGRKLLDLMGKAVGQSFVVENKGGAGGTLGMADALKGAPDGYTLALSAISPITLSPHLMKLPYNPAKDMVAVAAMMYSPVYVLATPAFTGKNWEELIAQAKAKAGHIRIATAGVGSVGHIMLEQIQAKTGAQLVHVPYKGTGQMVTDAMGGQFELMLVNPFSTINGMIEQGKLRVIATTGPQRAPSQPSIPTLAEQGIPEANITSTFGFMGPAGISADVIARINELVQEQLKTPAMQEALRSSDNIPLHMSPQEFGELMQKESANNATIIAKAKITL